MRDQPRRPTDLHAVEPVVAYDIETISAAEQQDGFFPPWPTHRPIALGLARAEEVDGEWVFELEALIARDTDGADLVEALEQRLGTVRTVATFNGRGFDAPVMRLAALRSRRFDLPQLAAHAHAQRFGATHADLAELFSSYGSARRPALADICTELGIPVKTSVHGSDVAALWLAGEIGQIRAYVLEDAVATLVLYFMWAAHRAADEALLTRPLAALARHIERTPEVASLMPFATCELAGWARPRALRAEIAAAIARQQARVRRAADEASFLPAEVVPIRR